MHRAQTTMRSHAVTVDGTVISGSWTKSLAAASRNDVSPSWAANATISARPTVRMPNIVGALRSTTVTSGRRISSAAAGDGRSGLAVVLTRASLAGSRKIARISGGAAMNSTIRDWTTSTMSTGMPWEACMAKPPALKAPNSSPAHMMPIGLDRPSRATVIASKPMPASRSVVMPAVTVPSTWLTPARPTSAPEMSITTT